jgi:hypothetical protein
MFSQKMSKKELLKQVETLTKTREYWKGEVRLPVVPLIVHPF